jgi:hypothetical protein
MDEEVTVIGEEWTDKRMDDFVGRVERFEGDVKDRFDHVDGRFDKVDAKLDWLNRTVWGGIVVAVLVKLLLG